MKFSRYDHNHAKVMLCLLHVYERDGRATFRQVADGAGLSLKTTYQHLIDLRAERQVDWQDGRSGTLRPLVREVVR